MASRLVQLFLHSSRQCRGACPGMSSPLKIVPLHVGSGPHLRHASLAQQTWTKSMTQTASWPAQLFLRSSHQSVVGHALPLRTAPSHGGPGPWSNLWFLGSTRLSIADGISIDSAVFAQLMANSPYSLHWGPISPKIATSHGGSGPHLTHDSLGPPKSSTQTAFRRVHPFLHCSRQSIPVL